MKKLVFLSLVLLVGCTTKNTKTAAIDAFKTADVEQAKAASTNEHVAAPEESVAALPATVTLADQNDKWQIYLNEEKGATESDIAQVTSVWLVDRQNDAARRLFVTNPEADLQWEQMADKNAVSVSFEQIAAAEKACFVPGSDRLVLVEGCPDARNVWTYIIDVENMTAKQFPATEGLVSFDQDAQQVVMGTYSYHEEGGRYSIQRTFTIDGKFVSEVAGEDE